MTTALPDCKEDAGLLVGPLHSLFLEAKLPLYLVSKQSLSFPRVWLEGALPCYGLRQTDLNPD